MNLVIVESPAKAKTIEKYLGKDYKVLASFGHVRDLPQKSLGIDLKDNYKPEYEILPKAKKTIAGLKSIATKADIVYLATDLDREGEAISWHLAAALNLKKSAVTKRIVFNEITKTAIEKAVKNPQEIDINLVDAQQARRVLDRLVGYKLSPLLWKKVKKGLSAGRVQSVTVRLVVEKEREIENFKPIEYWVLGVRLSQQGKELIFPAYLTEIDGKSVTKYDIKTKDQAGKITADLENSKYTVADVKHEDSIRKPAAPFATSTLQMEASRKLGFSPKQTMVLAQHLYEAGHITYMRTDSINLSSEAIGAIKKTILDNYGEKYLSATARIYATKTKHAQEAHEAIRPTHFDKLEVTNDRRGQKLYDLIWKRAVATQMSDAVLDILTVKIGAKSDKYIFSAKGEAVKFDGFMKLYLEGHDEESETQVAKIPELKKAEELKYIEKIEEQKFTEPPKRYSEATLVKKLESLGIGRPSTYAPTLETIQQRGYVELVEKRFQPTDIGKIVTDLLVKHFTEVVDYKFTADMEDELDDIADGKRQWQKVIDEFYQPFAKNLKEKTKEIDKNDIMPVEKTGEKCPECDSELVIRHGRFGKFIACSNYPTCKYSRPLETKIELDNSEVTTENGGTESLKEAETEKCEKCGGKMILKEGRFGKFLACENYPKCKNTITIVGKTGIKCPKCEEGEVIERRTKRGRKFWGCSKYPKCDYASWEEPKENDKIQIPNDK
ncbi:type I DNA topoisomerase [Candidatus Berkelbacteria bacterium CG10_big_fil_rev_8_21_14_0_10_43_13]|uniref:DNA topoisomerase 1 n=1 Tax=Candidatus Berkelbacteria bacterium CG10_big_fil_rev_8_21_14_0_10_43_13 TaxID=1974514 RepID=A0A2H0W8Z3_9BACT|nr:MAG: type I DNA topoisomerase [Candidatus Berkelbacteria bacterium CG10_big_fil_rev_8_21_14_0_10_43_13]